MRNISRRFPRRVTGSKQAKYADKHEDVFCPSDTTVDTWFSFWVENIVGDLAPNTLRNYRERYKQNIQPIIGKMLLSDVKPMHCKKVLLSDGCGLCRFYHPADLYHNGYDVQGCEDE